MPMCFKSMVYMLGRFKILLFIKKTALLK